MYIALYIVPLIMIGSCLPSCPSTPPPPPPPPGEVEKEAVEEACSGGG